MPDTTDSAGRNALSIGDLFNVDSAIPADRATMVYDTASGEYKHVAPVAVIDIATADGSDPATTQALANATKAKVNDLLAKLRVKGVV